MLETLLKRFLKYSTAGPALTRFYVMPHVKIHHIHRSDEEFHNHPWSGLSIIFGSYLEELEGDTKLRRRYFFNWVSSKRKHKVVVFSPVWTLFINGMRVNETWQYGEKTQPWNNLHHTEKEYKGE